MTQERKPTDDLKEGLDLIFRAARGAAKRVDVSMIDRGLDRTITEVTKVVTRVGRVVADEVNRMAASPPPWSRAENASSQASAEKTAPNEGEGDVQASSAPSQDQTVAGEQDDKPSA